MFMIYLYTFSAIVGTVVGVILLCMLFALVAMLWQQRKK